MPFTSKASRTPPCRYPKKHSNEIYVDLPRCHHAVAVRLRHAFWHTFWHTCHTFSHRDSLRAFGPRCVGPRPIGHRCARCTHGVAAFNSRHRFARGGQVSDTSNTNGRGRAACCNLPDRPTDAHHGGASVKPGRHANGTSG